jgi:hypothetical protein
MTGFSCAARCCSSAQIDVPSRKEDKGDFKAIRSKAARQGFPGSFDTALLETLHLIDRARRPRLRSGYGVTHEISVHAGHVDTKLERANSEASIRQRSDPRGVTTHDVSFCLAYQSGRRRRCRRSPNQKFKLKWKFAWTSLSYHTSYTIMAKGKNHDRKAQPGFGKPKSSAGEFNLKKVKGESSFNFSSRHTSSYHTSYRANSTGRRIKYGNH